MPGISSENQGQPSPISVLEPPFEDDNAAGESPDCMTAGQLGNTYTLPSHCHSSYTYMYLFDFLG